MKRQLFVIALILVAICPADEAARSDAETQRKAFWLPRSLRCSVSARVSTP